MVPEPLGWGLVAGGWDAEDTTQASEKPYLAYSGRLTPRPWS